VRFDGDGGFTMFYNADSDTSGTGIILSPDDPEFDDIYEIENL
jgi:hypothetical protein